MPCLAVPVTAQTALEPPQLPREPQSGREMALAGQRAGWVVRVGPSQRGSGRAQKLWPARTPKVGSYSSRALRRPQQSSGAAGGGHRPALGWLEGAVPTPRVVLCLGQAAP